MSLDGITLAIITVDRQPEYIHQTLASLFAADPLVHSLPQIYLMVGTANCDYLNNYRHHAQLQICPLDNATHDELQTWTIHRRFNHNYRRALTLPLAPDGGICVFEDDVVFRDLFFERLLETVREMEADAGLHDYALALTSSYDLESDPSFFRGRRFCSYGYQFFGSQSMYYPTQTATYLSDVIYREGILDFRHPVDLLVKDSLGDRIYACPRSLTCHIGTVSSGLGGAACSPSFARPYELLTQQTWGRY